VIAGRLVNSFRASSLKQFEIPWKIFQAWLKDTGANVSVKSILLFCIFLREVKNLATNTIIHYKNSLTLPLQLAAELDLNSYPFNSLAKNLFLERPPPSRHIPRWNLDKVLKVVSSPKYRLGQPSPFLSLKRTLFLMALASGNRVSELAALERAGIRFSDGDTEVTLVVRPGFLFKNQRLGRTPPNIMIKALDTGPASLCPVRSLREYLSTEPGSEGPLFRNSRTKGILRPASISRLLCELIKEGDPHSFPMGHDLRRQAVSLAWTRGLNPQDIAARTFWNSSSVFVDKYLSAQHSRIPCVALNTIG
jgi:integrase